MRALLRRLSVYLVAAFVALTFSFLLPRVVPGNPVAGAVACEHSSGAISSVRRRRKAQNQKLRVSAAKSGNWFSPVGLVAIRPALFPRNFFAVTHQPRALPAGHNFFVQHAKLRARFRHWPHLRDSSSCDSTRNRESLPRTSSRKSALATFLFQFAARHPSRLA